MSWNCRCLLALLGAAAAPASTLVLPEDFAGLESSGSIGVPFGSNQASRYQQVFSASHFPAQPILISRLAFRRDKGQPSYTLNIANIQIEMLTTSANPGALALDFASNRGPSQPTTVYQGALSMTSASTTTPRAFELAVNLSTGFRYNPASGNLLMDVTVTSPNGTSRALDGFASSAVSSAVFNLPAGGATVYATGGLVTQFTYTDAPPQHTPEPAALAPLLVAVLALLSSPCRGVCRR